MALKLAAAIVQGLCLSLSHYRNNVRRKEKNTCVEEAVLLSQAN